jgi:hypothetical protein
MQGATFLLWVLQLTQHSRWDIIAGYEPNAASLNVRADNGATQHMPKQSCERQAVRSATAFSDGESQRITHECNVGRQEYPFRAMFGANGARRLTVPKYFSPRQAKQTQSLKTLRGDPTPDTEFQTTKSASNTSHLAKIAPTDTSHGSRPIGSY